MSWFHVSSRKVDFLCRLFCVSLVMPISPSSAAERIASNAHAVELDTRPKTVALEFASADACRQVLGNQEAHFNLLLKGIKSASRMSPVYAAYLGRDITQQLALLGSINLFGLAHGNTRNDSFRVSGSTLQSFMAGCTLEITLVLQTDAGDRLVKAEVQAIELFTE